MHEHNHHYDIKKQGNRILISIVLNILITTLQIIGGVLSNSLALISDALHNFSDVISLIISYIAQILKHKKKPTEKYTFGYKRAEIIAAFINSSTLIILSIFIFKTGIEKILNISKSDNIDPKIIITLSIVSIVVNAVSAYLLFKDSKNNLNIKSSFLHLLSDMFTSIGVLISGILILYFEDIKWVDYIISFIIALYLIYHSFSIFIKSLEILMQFTPKGINVKSLISDIKNIKGIKDIFHIHIWRLDDEEIHFEARIIYDENFSIDNIITKQKEISLFLLKKHKINHITIQPEKKYTDTKYKNDKLFIG